MNQLLSIVIPTLNRALILKETIGLLKEEVRPYAEYVSITISDNCSDDDTENVVKATDGVRYHRWESRVDIEGSIKRAVDLCKTRFVCIFGDDDIPLPGFIAEVLRAINTMPNPELIYINRLIGDNTLRVTNEIAHIDKPFGVRMYSLSDFIEKYTHYPGFISSLVINKSAWDRGAWAHKEEFQGFGFLARIYMGISHGQVIFIAAPLVIQRRGVQTWKCDWPDFWLISIPNLLKFLDREGKSTTAFRNWLLQEVTLISFLKDCLVAKGMKHSMSSRFWGKVCSNQTTGRSIVARLIQFLVPTFLAKAIFTTATARYRKEQPS